MKKYIMSISDLYSAQRFLKDERLRLKELSTIYVNRFDIEKTKEIHLEIMEIDRKLLHINILLRNSIDKLLKGVI